MYKKPKNFFTISKASTTDKLKNFSKYVRRQDIARFMVYHELFRKQIGIKGSVVECGVHQGGSIMSWAKISSILEPYNYHRKIIGFDTFKGFPKVSKIDKNNKIVKKGMFSETFNILDDIKLSIKDYDKNRFINHISKIELIKGDATKTIPQFLRKNKHLLISLLFLDFDIYKPTFIALKYFLPRMSKGAIIAFDELNNKQWPGETMALLKKFNINKHKINNFQFEPNISYIILK